MIPGDSSSRRGVRDKSAPPLWIEFPSRSWRVYAALRQTAAGIVLELLQSLDMRKKVQAEREQGCHLSTRRIPFVLYDLGKLAGVGVIGTA